MNLETLLPSKTYIRHNRQVGVLVYTKDPAEHALCAAIYIWCDTYFGDDPVAPDSCFTHQRNLDGPCFVDGFDFYSSRATMKKFLEAWRVVFDPVELSAVAAEQRETPDLAG